MKTPVKTKINTVVFKALMTTMLVVVLSFQANAQFKTLINNVGNQVVNKAITSDHIKTLQSLYHPEKGRNSAEESFTAKSLAPSALNFSKLKVLGYNEEQLPIAITGKIKDNNRSNKDLYTKSLEYLEAASGLTKIQDPGSELQLISRVEDELGITHFRFQQKYQGVNIYGSEVLVHGQREQINYLNGRWHKSLLDFNIIPNLKAEDVLRTITQEEHLLQNKDPMGIMGDMEPKSELVIYYFEQEPVLVYHITGYPDKLHRWEYFVDANSGKLINKYMNSCKFHNHEKIEGDEVAPSAPSFPVEENTTFSVLDGAVQMDGIDLFNRTIKLNCIDIAGTRYMIDAVRPMFKPKSALPNEPEGAIWTIDAFNSSPQKDDFNYDHVKTTGTSWTNKQAAVSAHVNGAKAYEYFTNIHKRNSINGIGGNIVSLINVADEDGKTMGNAFWNGAAMFYGNGDGGFLSLARGLDVAGHEMTHGVVQNTANLEYQGESGALNESFADVFGMLIDREDWKIGEDVVKSSAFPSGALRDLSDPHNGAAQNDYGAGFQPKHYNERYTGTQDNGGVHINSGIPNHAFFLFANSNGVGLERAEQVYYRALSTYLTKSSRFSDAKLAVMKAAQDLYGASVASAAEAAFNNVGVSGTSGGGNTNPGDQYQTDLQVNPGADLILLSNGDQSDIYMVNTQVELIFEPKLSETDPISKPSVSDDGSEIVFIGTDKKFHNISVNYQTGKAQEQILLEDFDFRNVVISKDGRRLALLFDEYTPEVVIIDLGIGMSKVFELKNPTTAQGISTGDVQFADAMEFDHSGEYLMYDAFNSIKSPTAGEIEYWDISFVKVWELNNNNFQPENMEVFDKLFSGLPEGVSVGNPTFAKNSPYIVAFDYLDDEENYILGANIETGDVDILAETFDLGYPTYSKDDSYILYDAPSVLSDTKIKFIEVNENKISSNNKSGSDLVDDAKWAVWFSNGQRILTEVEEKDFALGLELSPNPANQMITSTLTLQKSSDVRIMVFDMNGKLVGKKLERGQLGKNQWSMDIGNLSPGAYAIQILFDEHKVSRQFVKQ